MGRDAGGSGGVGATGAALHRLLHAPVWLYRWHCGWLLGQRFLLLIHSGRRTGRQHCTVLEVMEVVREPREWVVMRGFGPGANWFRNIKAAGGAEIVIGRERVAVGYRILVPAEAADVIARYEARHRMSAPLVRLVLSKLLGWRYDGSPASRLRAAEELPLVAFRRAGSRQNAG